MPFQVSLEYYKGHVKKNVKTTLFSSIRVYIIHTLDTPTVSWNNPHMKRRIPQQKRNKLLPVYLVGALVVLAVGFMIYRGVRKEIGNPILLSSSDVPRISAADAIVAIREEGAILLDTRTASQYEVDHAWGSISTPFIEIESWVDTLDKKAWYITYCT